MDRWDLSEDVVAVLKKHPKDWVSLLQEPEPGGAPFLRAG